MLVEVSIGEVVDKISILSIKLEEIEDIVKLSNVQKEFRALTKVTDQNIFSDDLYRELCRVNKELWRIEDNIREKEHAKEFDGVFIDLARSVYVTNDKRAALKKEINLKYGSEFVEEKSYK